jgi:hypothetical protein
VETSGDAQEVSAPVHADHPPAWRHESDEIADDHSGTAAYLEHGVTAPYRHEAKEPAPQARLAGRAAARLQNVRELRGVGTAVDVSPGIRVGGGGSAGQRSSA